LRIAINGYQKYWGKKLSHWYL